VPDWSSASDDFHRSPGVTTVEISTTKNLPAEEL
jgi:hypothetical protein